MDKSTVSRLASAVLTAGFDGRIVPVSGGREFALMLAAPRQWYLWSVADWNEFLREHKKKQHAKPLPTAAVL